MLIRSLIALYLLTTLLAACAPATPSPTPTMLPTRPPPTQTPSPQPTPTPIPPTGTPTIIPTRPAITASGEIFVTLAGRAHSNAPAPKLVHFLAGCLDCPDLPEVTGFQNPNAIPLPLYWSPDGKYAAYTSASSIDGKPALILYNPQNGSWKTLLELNYLAQEVFWSPDGQWIACQGEEKGKQDFFVVRPDGTGLKNVTQGMLEKMPVVSLGGWLADPLGDRLIFTGGGPAGYYLYTVTLRNPLPQKRSNVEVFRGYAQGFPPAYPSPDGKWLLYAEINDFVGQSVKLLDLKKAVNDHSVANFKTGTLSGYRWSPNSNWLAMWFAFSDRTELYLVHPDGSNLHPVYSNQQGIRSAIFDPHGGDLLLVETAGDQPSQLVFVPTGQGEPAVIQSESADTSSWEGASWRP